MTSDSALVRRVLDGDTSAFTVLADRHASACLRFATRMLGSRDDAEDATQETLVRAYRALGSYDEQRAFRTWLFAILVNRCRSALLSKSRREQWVSRDDVAVARSATGSHDRSAELRVELERAMAVLPSEQREAFLLKYVEQLEYTEMAAITGTGVSALKMRVQRACVRLRQELHEYDGEFGGGDGHAP
jgi:RNA polymerase sigma-70 factor (ECF subfamily)